MLKIAGGIGSSRLLIVVSNGNSRTRREGLLKRSGLGVFSALAIAVPAALVYADANQGKWCPLDPGQGNTRSTQLVDTAGQYDRPYDEFQAERMGSGIDPMVPGNGDMNPSAGNSNAPPAGNVTARHEKNGDFQCPGKTTETGAGSGEAGGKVEKGE